MKKLFFIYILVSFFFVACSPNDGEDGAMGPQGVQGEQGPEGEQGEQGESGTANVVYSDWIPSGFESSIADTNAYFNIQNVEALTDGVKANGYISVYGRYTAAYTIIEPLPKSIFGLRMQHYDFQINDINQNITIRITSIDGSNIEVPIYDEYRYIIIPGGVSTAGKSVADYSRMSYEEIVALFNIPK